MQKNILDLLTVLKSVTVHAKVVAMRMDRVTQDVTQAGGETTVMKVIILSDLCATKLNNRRINTKHIITFC